MRETQKAITYLIYSLPPIRLASVAGCTRHNNWKWEFSSINFRLGEDTIPCSSEVSKNTQFPVHERSAYESNNKNERERNVQGTMAS